MAVLALVEAGCYVVELPSMRSPRTLVYMWSTAPLSGTAPPRTSQSLHLASEQIADPRFPNGCCVNERGPWVYIPQDKNDEVVDQYEKGIDALALTHGSSHPAVACATRNLAGVLMEQVRRRGRVAINLI